jgi:hypothetical protein
MPENSVYPDLTSPNSIHPICALFESNGKPNLIEPIVYSITDADGNVLGVRPSAGFDPNTGFYDSVDIEYSIENDGTAPTTESFDNQFISTFRVNTPGLTSSPDYTVVHTISDILTPTPPTNISGPDWIELATNVPPGDYRVAMIADLVDDIDEENEDDNDRTIIGSLRPSLPPEPDPEFDPLPPPDPGIVLSIAPEFVRYDEPATLSWTMAAWYPMECTVKGPGGVIRSFDPNISVADRNGSVDTFGITAKSEFLIECIEKISGYNNAFTDTAVVETTGKVEEV